MAGVVLVSRDATIVAEVRRLCAVIGATVDVRAEDAALAHLFGSASVVVVDVAIAAAVRGVSLPRPRHALVVAAGGESVEAWRLAARIGADVVLTLPRDEHEFVERVLLATEDHGPPGRLVGVQPAASGAGASTLAAALALRSAHRGATTTLLDADADGGGLDLLLGAEHRDGARWPDLRELSGTIGAEALGAALVQVGGIRLLSAGRDGAGSAPPDAMAAVLPAVRRGQDLVVVDLPRRLDPAATLAASCCDVLVLVVPAEVRAAAVGARTLAAAAATGADVRLVVRAAHPSRLRPGEIGAVLDRAVAAVVETEPGVAAATDRGDLVAALPRSRIARVADRLLDELVPRPAAA